MVILQKAANTNKVTLPDDILDDVELDTEKVYMNMIITLSSVFFFQKASKQTNITKQNKNKQTKERNNKAKTK